MYKRSVLTLLSPLLVLLLLVIGGTNSVRNNYEAILEDERFDENLRLLGPEALLRSYIRLDEDEAVNEDCLRDLAIYQRAIGNRESWALRSERDRQ